MQITQVNDKTQEVNSVETHVTGGRAHFAGLCNQIQLASDFPIQHPLQIYPRPPPKEFMSPGQQQIISEDSTKFTEELERSMTIYKSPPHLGENR